MIKPIGLISGHYESRSLKQSIPILTELLALEIVSEKAREVTMKHPNTDWLLVVHEGRPDAPDKPRLNHYGVRVATNQETDNALEYLKARKEQLHLKVDKTQNRHMAYSVHFVEPGGCWWEIESYEDGVKKNLARNVSNPWKTPLLPERFPGRGYIPQAMTHGTIGCINLEASRRFYREVLGLDVVAPYHSNNKPHYIKHPSTPWIRGSVHQCYIADAGYDPLRQTPQTVNRLDGNPIRPNTVRHSLPQPDRDRKLSLR